MRRQVPIEVGVKVAATSSKDGKRDGKGGDGKGGDGIVGKSFRVETDTTETTERTATERTERTET